MMYQISALLLLLVFYSCYYAKMISQKKQGIQTDQIGKGKAGAEKAIEITMKVATILTPIAEGISIILNTTLFPDTVRSLGVFLSVVGVAFFVVAVLTMRDSWRAGVSRTDKTALVTKGIFQISRNPAFLGFDLVYVGILLMFFNLVLFVISAVNMIIFHLQIVYVEERFLASEFGDAYADYKGKVRRYFGRRSKKPLARARSVLLVVTMA